MCGYAVDWLFTCYESQWSFFPDDPTIVTRGRFVRTPPDFPFYPGFHQFGSRNWTQGEYQDHFPISESRTAVQKWTAGQTPEPYPDAKAIGLPICIEGGEKPQGLTALTAFTHYCDFSGNFLEGKLQLWDTVACGGNQPVDSSSPQGGEGFLVKNLLGNRTCTINWQASLCPSFASGPAGTHVDIITPNGTTRVDANFGPANCTADHFNGTITFACPQGESLVELDIIRPNGIDVGKGEYVSWKITINPSDFSPLLYNGYDVRCYKVIPGGNVGRHYLWSQEELSSHAGIIEFLYTDLANAILAVQQWSGGEGTVAGVPVSSQAGSGVVLLKTAGRQFAWIVGTTTNQQLLDQAVQMQQGPVPFLGAGTLPIWRAAAAVASNFLDNLLLDPTIPFTIFGHSLGGCVAWLLACQLRTVAPAWEIEVATFGMPKTGNAAFWKTTEGIPNVNVVNDGDPIPYLAPAARDLGIAGLALGPIAMVKMEAFEPPSDTWSLYDDGSFIEGGPRTPLFGALTDIFAAWVLNLPQPEPAVHSIATYRIRLAKGS